ncbi:transposase [Streptomyces parvus]|uniref:transposase n=1 Tax=Streptomyces parvus TaxID=66428 RepID=UPI0033D34CFF
MTTIKDQVAAEATMTEREWTNVIGAAMAAVANCFTRREPRLLAPEMCEAMLMELDTRNCWTLAEALGHCGPHRLQHFLARARIDHDLARDGLAAWITSELADGQAVLVVDETGDEKSSGDAVGAAHRYSGALGGVGLCQVAVHLTCAFRSWPPICASAPEPWASVPAGWPATRCTAGANCAWPPAVWASTAPWPSRRITASPPPPAPSQPPNSPDTFPGTPGHACAPATASRAIATTTGLCSAYPPTTPPPDTRPVTLTWSSAVTATPANSPSTAVIPPRPLPWPPTADSSRSAPCELLRLLRATVLPSPRRNLDHLLHWSAWRREHQHRAAEAHRRWNNVTAAATT